MMLIVQLLDDVAHRLMRAHVSSWWWRCDYLTIFSWRLMTLFINWCCLWCAHVTIVVISVIGFRFSSQLYLTSMIMPPVEPFSLFDLCSISSFMFIYAVYLIFIGPYNHHIMHIIQHLYHSSTKCSSCSCHTAISSISLFHRRLGRLDGLMQM